MNEELNDYSKYEDLEDYEFYDETEEPEPPYREVETVESKMLIVELLKEFPKTMKVDAYLDFYSWHDYASEESEIYYDNQPTAIIDNNESKTLNDLLTNEYWQRVTLSDIDFMDIDAKHNTIKISASIIDRPKTKEIEK